MHSGDHDGAKVYTQKFLCTLKSAFIDALPVICIPLLHDLNMPTRIPLSEINALSAGQFIAALGNVFEHSPWVAERVVDKRPFADVSALHAAMTDALSAASPVEQLALIRAHPELAGREAVEGSLTVDSGSEQGRLGLIALSRTEFQRMADLNRRYRERFGFPCIIALALHADRESVFRAFESRLKNGQEQELANALEQIGHITRARLEKMLGN